MSGQVPHTDSTQAMQSLFSAYADDEDAADDDTRREKDDISDDDADEVSSQISMTRVPSTVPVPDGSQANNVVEDAIQSVDDIESDPELPQAEDEPERVEIQMEAPPPKLPRLQKTATSLVSYGADEVEDDEDRDSDEPEDDVVSGFTSFPARLVEYETTMNQSELNASLSRSIRHSQEEQFQLPPEPPGKCSTRVQDKVSKLYQRMQREGLDLNAKIQNRKDFRNPHIYEKLVEFCGIDEKGTNYPPELYNCTIWGPDSYYDELARIQKQEMDRREKEKKERTKIEFITGTKKPTVPADTTAASTDQKAQGARKSKWDSTAPVVKDSKDAHHATLTSTGTNSSTTVISAVGPITKHK